MSEFTPGPWRVCKNGACQCKQVWSETADHPVAEVLSGEWGDTYPAIKVENGIGGKAEAVIEKIEYGVIDEEYAKANARLIAASPDLYQALEAVNELIAEASGTGFNPNNGDWAERLFKSQRKTSSALAKARGEE